MQQELKQRVESAIESIQTASMRLYGYGDNNTQYLIETRNLIKELAEREEKLIKTLKQIAATKNIKMSEMQGTPYNWQRAENILKELNEMSTKLISSTSAKKEPIGII